MKQSTPELGKFKKLVRRLRPLDTGSLVDPATVVAGLLERLWLATANNTRSGAIGRLDDETIAELLGWLGDPADLVAALVETGWLDEHETHRLIVHHWRDHCPRYVVAAVMRDYLAGRGGWADGHVPEDWHEKRQQSGQQNDLQTEQQSQLQKEQQQPLPSRVESSRAQPSQGLGSNRLEATSQASPAVAAGTKPIPPPDRSEAATFGRKVGHPNSDRDKLLCWQLVGLKHVLGEGWLANITTAIAEANPPPKTPWAYARKVAADGSREIPGPGQDRLKELLKQVPPKPDDWPERERSLHLRELQESET